MSHEPTLYRDDPEYATWEAAYWFECSCGFMCDTRPNVYHASIRWQLHMNTVVTEAIRDAVERGPKHAVDH